MQPERVNLAIREDKRRGVFVEGLSEWVVRSPGEVYQLMARGQSLVSCGWLRYTSVAVEKSWVCCLCLRSICLTWHPAGGAGESCK